MTAPSLFVGALDARLSASERAAVEARFSPLLAAGALRRTDGLVVARLAEIAGVADPLVLLGLAFAVRAPGHGHVCVDLTTLTLTDVLPDQDPAEAAAAAALARPAWPTDGADWHARVADCAALVRAAPPASDAPDPPTTPFVVEHGQLYSDRWWRYQRALACSLRARADAPLRPLSATVSAGLDLLFRPPGGHAALPGLNRQRLAGAVALLSPLTVLSGGPGMGKTWTVRNVLALLWLQHAETGAAEGLRVALAAPTGKAAARMRESLRAGLDPEFLSRLDQLGGDGAGERFRAFVLDLEPRTLHRLLGFRPDRPTRFRHHARAPLPVEVVVVDEASMVDLAMMHKLVDATPATARLVLLGDRNQLASVEAGTVLADVCGPTAADDLALPANVQAACAAVPGLEAAAAVPVVDDTPLRGAVVQLNRTFRFDERSGIGAFARACLERPFDVQRALDILEDPARPDITRRPGPTREGLPARELDAICEGYLPALRLLEQGYDPEQHGCVAVYQRQVLDAFDRFRVLAAHRKGPGGVAGLNRSIAAALREHTPALAGGGDGGWLGRPVLVLENAYAVGRFNGDIGIGMTRTGRLDGSPPAVVFPGPDPLPEGWADPDRHAEVADAVESGALRLVELLEPARLPAWQPVYAMTIHKSQGSEFAHAMVVLPERPSPILTRELLYTGVTRAKSRVTLVGSPAVLRLGLERVVRRASGLAKLLWPDAADAKERS